MTREKIHEINESAVLWDGCDNALIGVTDNGKAVYSIEKLWRIFQDMGMTQDESVEWVDFNILSAYVGEYTPVHVYQS